MHPSKRLALPLLALALAGPAVAQRYTLPPDSVDLQAAYCLGLWQVISLPDPAVEEILKDKPDGLANYLGLKRTAAASIPRLRGYLIPRMQFVDAAGLLVARGQADRDLADAAQSGGSMNEKFIRCRDMAFLPY